MLLNKVAVAVAVGRRRRHAPGVRTDKKWKEERGPARAARSDALKDSRKAGRGRKESVKASLAKT